MSRASRSRKIACADTILRASDVGLAVQDRGGEEGERLTASRLLQHSSPSHH